MHGAGTVGQSALSLHVANLEPIDESRQWRARYAAMASAAVLSLARACSMLRRVKVPRSAIPVRRVLTNFDRHRSQIDPRLLRGTAALGRFDDVLPVRDGYQGCAVTRKARRREASASVTVVSVVQRRRPERFRPTKRAPGTGPPPVNQRPPVLAGLRSRIRGRSLTSW